MRKAPAWPPETDKTLDFDTLLARTVAEGPGTLFLVPDEFFPLAPLLEEPIARNFGRWNKAAEVLLEGKLKEDDEAGPVPDRGHAATSGSATRRSSAPR